MKENFDLLICGGSVCLPNEKIEKVDIGIKNSKIQELGDLSHKSCKLKLDVNNLLVLPGVIDSQVHFREPGLTYKEDIYSGTKGAVLGGITSIFEMPNTKPSTTNQSALEDKLEIAKSSAFCNYSFFVGAAKDNIQDLTNLERISGCCGVKIFMGSSTGDLLVEDDESLKQILKSINRRVAVHSEDEYRLRERKKVLDLENVTVHDHPRWRDVETAVNSTKRLLKIATELEKNVHVLHISTKEEIELLKSYKHIATCEATPQHLFFSSPDCYDRLGSFVQMNPPIRDEAHREGIWNGIKEKVIDVVGSDHAPHTIDEKKKVYPDTPSGMTGVQTILPIMLNFVNQGKISIHDLVRLLCFNPAKIYKILNKGEVKIGNDADFSVIDLNKEFLITNDWIVSKSRWTPYDNVKVKGFPVMTIVNGKVVMRDDEIILNSSGKPVEFEIT